MADWFEKVVQDLKGLKAQGTGILVWRVNQLKLELVDSEDYGTFYRGDCYVVVSIGSKENCIFFWQGSQSSQDEQAFSAYMAVQLDDLLFEVMDINAVQYREISDFESAQFKSTLKTVCIIEGGYKTAMNQVSKPPHLFKVKGKTTAFMTEVPCRDSYMTSNDSFILDVSKRHHTVYVIIGEKSNKTEAIKALEAAGRYGVKVKIIDQCEINDCQDEDNEIIRMSLGVSRSKPILIRDAVADIDDEKYEEEQNRSVELCQVRDGTITYVPIKQSSLDSGDCFVLKSASKVFVWKGRQAIKDEKEGAISKAQEFIKEKGMKKTTPIVIIPEDAETVDFKACFATWRGKDEVYDPVDYSRPAVQGNVAKSVHTVIDFRTLYDKPKPKTGKDRLVEDDADNGGGKTTIYRIVLGDRSTDKVLEKRDGFVFNSADSYVIIYVYRSKRARNQERTVIYYWIGNDSEQLEHGAAALMASHLDETQFYGGAIQIRVTEAKEPAHFMKIFGGYIMVRQEHKQDDNGFRLFHIRGKQGNIKVVEVDVDAGNLDSNDCFVLKTPQRKVYIWLGKGSLGDEQRIAHEAAESMFGTSCDFSKIVEGKTETEEFWKAIGGRKVYQNKVYSDDTTQQNSNCAAREPRLFRLFNIRGSLEAEEIYDFIQDDLNGDDVFLLDTFTSIYLWIGKDCRPDEKKMAIKNLQTFIKNEPTNRDEKNLQIQTIRQGFEPEDFKDHFGAWEEHRVAAMTLEDAKRLRIEENKKISKIDFLKKQQTKSYPYVVLIKSDNELPEDVDPTEKESYLTDAEFVSVFGQEKVDFYRLAKWKQDKEKKAVNLF